jgi:hypothetical protein
MDHLHLHPRYPGTPRESRWTRVDERPDATRCGADPIAAAAKRAVAATSRSVTSFRIAAGPAVRKLLLHQVSPEVKQQRRAELERPAVRLVVRASGSLQEPIEVSAKPLLL